MKDKNETGAVDITALGESDDLLSAEEEIELAKRSAEGDVEARNILVCKNQRLVAMIAFRYVGMCKGLEFDDLKQAGNLGLIQAVKMFDYTKGYRFSTYAIWWIRQAITREIADKDRTIRLPVHIGETVLKIRRTAAKIEQQTGTPATIEDVAAALDMPPQKIKELWEMAWTTPTVSLDKPIGEDGDSTLESILTDPSDSPQEQADAAELKTKVSGVLSRLSPREQAVIRLRYGLIDGRPRTLEEVGEEYHVTRERVRQIEAKALRKLRSPRLSAMLNDFRV